MNLYLHEGVPARIIGTSLILYLIHNYTPIEQKLFAYTFIPFITDAFDGLLLLFNGSTYTYTYQSWDKILDFFTYLAVILLAKPFYPTYIFNLLIVLLIWKGIGVIKFTASNEVKHIWNHMDAVNSTMFVAYLSTLSPYIKQNDKLFIVLGILFKAIHERYIHHKKNYKL